MSVPALADGSILLHIGPYKTGTTAIQAALAENREALTAQGVSYPTRGNHEFSPAMAITHGRVDPGRNVDAHLDYWHQMVRGFHEQRPRIGVLSSEAYSEAKPERIGVILDELGPGAHVVITLRPLVRIIGSQWQQYLQNNRVFSYPEWLQGVLASPEPGPPTPTFWTRHRHDRLVERWLEAVGPERLTLLVVDDNDKTFLMRGFEHLLGLTTGTLDLRQAQRNRSLTFDEIEFVRAFNLAYGETGLGAADYTTFIRYAAMRALQARTPDPTDQRLLTPPWAVERTLELAEMIVGNIRALAVPRIVGDLSTLTDPAQAPATGENTPVDTVDPDAAAAFIGGLVNAAGKVHGGPTPNDNWGPVQHAVWSLHRAVNYASHPDWERHLRADNARLDRELAGRPPALWRRVRGRLKR
jgi:hypothetical protein